MSDKTQTTKMMGDDLDIEGQIANLIFDGFSGGEKAEALAALLKKLRADIIDGAKYGEGN